MAVPVPRDRVVEIFKKAAGRSLKAKDIGKQLGLGADDRSVVRDALRALADEGVLIQLESKRFVLAGASNAHRGAVQRKASGSGWFIPDDKKVGDAFLPPHELTGVVDGDRVLVTISRESRGPAAKIVRVIERRRTTVTGVFKDSGKSAWVEADDNVLSGPILIPPGPEGNAAAATAGDVVEVLLVEAPTTVTTAVGRIIRSLGKRGKLDVEIERIIAEKNVMRAFPPEVTLSAERFGALPSAEDMADREDYRDVALVTIDGETAKDFDDAVFARMKKSDVHVVVAIADVSHYVTQGSPLDVEAARRGTSIYYPGKVIPMLPEALSNGLCSLKPHVERLCMVAEFTVKKDGTVSEQRFANGVMRSHARLTYTIAQKFFDGDAETARAMTAEVKESLTALDEASKRLRKARQARGALDFDLPETVIALDEKGEPVKVHALERLNAHKLIEDLMVAANEAVAERFDEKGWPCVYRIHDPPDSEKLARFTKLAQLLAGRRVPGLDKENPGPSALMEVMKELAEIPGKRALDSLLLRSMMQAKYSAENGGHYGLGSEAYLHFTSPIRRYPDLVVHRLLKDRLAGKKSGKKKDGSDRDSLLLGELDAIATTSSNCERTATDIERSIDALYAAWFMKDRVGEEFDGLVQGVAEFGLFIVLEGVNVEGMVRVADIGGDYWVFDEVRLRLVGERSGRVFTIGDKLKVKVAGVDVAKRQIGLVPAEPVPDARGSRTDRRRDARGARDDDNAGPPPKRDGGARGSGAARDDGRGPHKRGDGRVPPRRDDARGGPKKRDDARGGKRGGARGGTRDDGRGNKRDEPRAGGAATTTPGERAKIRGPDDLRRLFDEKGGSKKSGGPKRGGKKRR